MMIRLLVCCISIVFSSAAMKEMYALPLTNAKVIQLLTEKELIPVGIECLKEVATAKKGLGKLVAQLKKDGTLSRDEAVFLTCALNGKKPQKRACIKRTEVRDLATFCALRVDNEHARDFFTVKSNVLKEQLEERVSTTLPLLLSLAILRKRFFLLERLILVAHQSFECPRQVKAYYDQFIALFFSAQNRAGLERFCTVLGENFISAAKRQELLVAYDQGAKAPTLLL